MSDLKVRIVAGNNAMKNGHMDMICDVTHQDMIYNKIVRMTENKDTANKVLDWVECAKDGEIYEFSDGRVEIEKRK